MKELFICTGIVQIIAGLLEPSFGRFFISVIGSQVVSDTYMGGVIFSTTTAEELTDRWRLYTWRAISFLLFLQLDLVRWSYLIDPVPPCHCSISKQGKKSNDREKKRQTKSMKKKFRKWIGRKTEKRKEKNKNGKTSLKITLQSIKTQPLLVSSVNPPNRQREKES